MELGTYSPLLEKIPDGKSMVEAIHLYDRDYSPEKDQRSGAIGRVKVGCRSGAYVGYFAVKLEILC